MASVHRRRKSKVWIAFFRDAYGVQHGRSTGLTNRKAAQRVADEYEAIRFGLCIGQRLMDIATLRWDNIDLAEGVIRLTTQKTDKSLIIPIGESLKEHISSLPVEDLDGYVHPKLSRTAQCTLSTEFRPTGGASSVLSLRSFQPSLAHPVGPV
jgi:integrase